MRGGGVIGALPGNLFGLPVHPAREGEGGVGHASGIRGLDIGEPVRTYSSFIHGYESMRVVIPARA